MAQVIMQTRMCPECRGQGYRGSRNFQIGCQCCGSAGWVTPERLQQFREFKEREERSPGFYRHDRISMDDHGYDYDA